MRSVYRPELLKSSTRRKMLAYEAFSTARLQNLRVKAGASRMAGFAGGTPMSLELIGSAADAKGNGKLREEMGGANDE